MNVWSALGGEEGFEDRCPRGDYEWSWCIAVAFCFVGLGTL